MIVISDINAKALTLSLCAYIYIDKIASAVVLWIARERERGENYYSNIMRERVGGKIYNI